MEPFHERLLSERAALVERAEKLHAFLSSPGSSAVVGDAQYRLMLDQFHHMQGYAHALDRRLALLGGS